MKRFDSPLRGLLMLTAAVTTVAALSAQSAQENDPYKNLPFRSIGPSLTSGRISDIAIDPKNPSIWYVAASAGNLWKTENRGNTWTPIFEDYGSYSLGAVVVDPRDSNVVWLGTGENNNQRSVSFGDGIYKSTDAGKTWKRMGLENSEHIQNIVIDPRNSNTVFVTAIGPLWNSGGERGLYKTTDGGNSWKQILKISDDTGVTDLVMDPKNPDTMYAAAYQRRRHVGQLIGGGPESGIYKTTDGGNKWTKLTKGLPTGDMGRVGLGINWRNPRTVYALVTAKTAERGFYRSDDAGGTWTRIGRMVIEPGGRGGRGGQEQQPRTPCQPLGGGTTTTTPQPTNGEQGGGQAGGRQGGPTDDCYRGGDPGYYNELIVDGNDPETLWSPQTNMWKSTDGGKTWREQPMPGVHVDHHEIIADPLDRNHYIIGNDGGVYETYDNFRTFRHFTNLPLSQFYRISTDNAKPFYHVCGGAQDNGTICGPSRTMNRAGIRTSDWYSVGGGDGFQARVDPEDPTIVYAQSQEGSLNRLDLKTGRSISIRPNARNVIDPKAPAQPQQPQGGQGGGRGAPGFQRFGRWHWDSPIIISPHSARRLYYGGERLYRSDDRGDSWIPVSADLTRQLDAAKLPIMGKVWPPDSVAFNEATTTLSTITTVDESPLLEGLLYVGTDDGLIQISEDGGKNWRKVEKLPGVAEYSYVTDVFASPRDANTVFVTLNNYQRGDFKPYVVKSTDRGKTWTSIASNLPERSGAWSIVQDHENGDLLFAGMEFGVWFSIDGGKHWTRLKSGIPTTQARDITIHRRDNDLVVGSFGRGVYILDDITPLRAMTTQTLSEEARLYPLRDAYIYDELGQYGSFWGNIANPNPPYGAVFTYSVAKAPASGEKLVLNITDEGGRQIRRLDLDTTTMGVNRVAWNMRPEPPAPAQGQQPQFGGGRGGQQQPPVAPGRYRASIGRLAGDKFTAIGASVTFQLMPIPRD